MILRSVMKHVREQNWAAVGLDFLIVVVGVFIGIQVSNWNDARQSQDELASALGNVAQEISNTIDWRGRLVKDFRETLRGLRLMSTWLEGAALDEAQRKLVYRALKRGVPPPSPSLYETLYQLRDSGRLKDIPSPDLRDALGLLLSRDRTYPTYRDHWAERLTAPPFSSAIVSLDISPPEALSPRDATRVTGVDIEAARGSPEVRNRVAQLYDFWYITTFDAQSAVQIERIALDLLQAEGFQPARNWMMENLETVQPDPQLEQTRPDSLDAPSSPSEESVR